MLASSSVYPIGGRLAIRLGSGPHDRGAVFLIRFPAVDDED